MTGPQDHREEGLLLLAQVGVQQRRDRPGGFVTGHGAAHRSSARLQEAPADDARPERRSSVAAPLLLGIRIIIPGDTTVCQTSV
jgi:hypothetical protein